jgi:hypothetical protein
MVGWMDGGDIQKLTTLVIKSQRKQSVGGNRNVYGTVLLENLD